MIEQEHILTQGITESLGIQGWNHLDPILLAALATEAPLLLIGPHGTAKSLLVEKVATALSLSLRHYNASLINYDDLVGIPLPEEGADRLQFITTPGAIWEAEFVFFDEISRCRPDLQNKMFPIVHERRVAGIQLAQLQHRWAAMNPPAPEDPDVTSGDYYLGSEPLDAALVDRFPFVVPVPGWKQLSKADRRRLVTRAPQAVEYPERAAPSLPHLVERCARLLPSLEEELRDWLTDYIVSVIDLLEQARIPESPRRAYMLARSLVAVHAARMVLEGDDADLEYSAELTLTFGLPQNASEVPPSRATIIAIHRQAWEISSLAEDDSWRQVLEELDAVKRIVLADQLDLSDADVSRLITQALGTEPSDARRIGLATAIFMAFRDRRELTPSAWEPLVQFVTRVLEPRTMTANLRPGPITDVWNEISSWMPTLEEANSLLVRLERNYVLSGFPDLWMRFDWKEALEQFRADLTLFNVAGK
ncbi:MAG: AAA domain-containing protein [Chloroflexi bacterium]|nr:AAA domain-containing protein [Chloroflexota bacterium]